MLLQHNKVISILLIEFAKILACFNSCLTYSFCAAAESKYANSRKDQHTATISSTTTSTAESSSSTSKLEEELKIASRLRKFAFNDLKMATRNFRPDSLLGEGGFGCVFKGWIEENGTAPVKPGTGLTVAVKTLNHDGLQGHKEWLVRSSLHIQYLRPIYFLYICPNFSYYLMFF